MSVRLAESRSPSSRRRRRGVIAGAAAAVLASVALVAGFLIIRSVTWRVPQFASLATHPDRSLQGTVAYYVDQTGCVRIVAAAGRPARTVFCVPAMDVGKAVKLGKEVGPQLVWLSGGRLQVTMFRMTPPATPGGPPGYHPGWQKVIDVRTGTIHDVPADALPATPNLNTHPVVSPSGQRISWTSDSGRVKIMLSGGGRSRTLLSAQGPPDYTYGLGVAFWAPNWHWIAADDGRILIITTGRHPVTRVLTDQSSQGAFEARFARFAVYGANILTPAG